MFRHGLSTILACRNIVESRVTYGLAVSWLHGLRSAFKMIVQGPAGPLWVPYGTSKSIPVPHGQFRLVMRVPKSV